MSSFAWFRHGEKRKLSGLDPIQKENFLKVSFNLVFLLLFLCNYFRLNHWNQRDCCFLMLTCRTESCYWVWVLKKIISTFVDFFSAWSKGSKSTAECQLLTRGLRGYQMHSTRFLKIFFRFWIKIFELFDKISIYICITYCDSNLKSLLIRNWGFLKKKILMFKKQMLWWSLCAYLVYVIKFMIKRQ